MVHIIRAAVSSTVDAVANAVDELQRELRVRKVGCAKVLKGLPHDRVDVIKHELVAQVVDDLQDLPQQPAVLLILFLILVGLQRIVVGGQPHAVHNCAQQLLHRRQLALRQSALVGALFLLQLRMRYAQIARRYKRKRSR